MTAKPSSVNPSPSRVSATQPPVPKRRAALFAALVLLAGGLGLGWSQEMVGGKVAQTPCFWQQDQDAGFLDGGSNYCAPTAISNGLIYLAQARGLTDLVPGGLAPGAMHQNQIDLIKELAGDMDTDPKSGTNPDKILTGLRRYVLGKGLRLNRLEVATWRRLSGGNRACWVGTQPKPDWMREAATNPDCVEVLNVGWYRAEESGYSRHSGHWVTVVDAGPGTLDFAIHNPAMHPQTQKAKMAVALTLLDKDFMVLNSTAGDTGNMSGYYKVDGPGLPLGARTAAAVLDSVIVFSVQK